MSTPTPWKVGREGEIIWIEGPKGSAATDRLPGDRRIVCEFSLYRDESLDAETKANIALIVKRVNER